MSAASTDTQGPDLRKAGRYVLNKCSLNLKDARAMFTASMKFDLGEDVEAMREMVHRWAQERVRPMAAEIDLKNEFPAEL